eukprot:4428159-Pleurochrysis_carterae.AAC.1
MHKSLLAQQLAGFTNARTVARRHPVDCFKDASVRAALGCSCRLYHRNMAMLNGVRIPNNVLQNSDCGY